MISELDNLINNLVDLRHDLSKRENIMSDPFWSIHKDSKYSKQNIKKQINQVKKSLTEFTKNNLK